MRYSIELNPLVELDDMSLSDRLVFTVSSKGDGVYSTTVNAGNKQQALTEFLSKHPIENIDHFGIIVKYIRIKGDKCIYDSGFGTDDCEFVEETPMGIRIKMTTGICRGDEIIVEDYCVKPYNLEI